MRVCGVTFGSYRSVLKTHYKNGLLPVRYGIYGETLKRNQVSIEHLIPRAQKGESKLENYALADRFKNEERGCRPLKDFVTPQTAIKYLAQFLDVKLPNFDGNEYVKSVIETLKKIGVFN